MEKEHIASSLIIVMLATLILGGIPAIPVNGSIVSYASATASNADRASPDEEECSEENSEDMDLINDLESTGVYIATDADAIDISSLENVSLYGVEQYSTEIEDSIAVRVPAVIKMESYDTSVDFQIEVAGILSENSVVMVEADETVVLESIYKDPINGVVSQDRDYIEASDLENGQATINGNITLDKGVSAGEWKGSFNISVWLDNSSAETAAYSVMELKTVESVSKASSSNAEKVEAVTDEVENSTEQEIVEQPEEIISEETEISGEAEDSTTSENVEMDPVISETEAVPDESNTEEDSENTDEEMEQEVEMDAEDEVNIASPSNATAV